MTTSAEVMKGMAKEYGDGVVSHGVVFNNVTRIKTGILPFDLPTGGGIPRGKACILYGPESCAAYDTFISFEVWNQDLSLRQNHKGGTLEKLYHRFHSIPMKGKGHYQRKQTEDSRFFVKSVAEDGRIISTEVLDVIKTGKKEVFRVTTSHGQTIRTTADHKYYVGDLEYKQLSELNVGDSVFIHNNSRVKGRKQYKHRPTITVRSHPTAKPTQYWKETKYYQIDVHRLTVESAVNNLSLDQYVEALNQGLGSMLKGIPNGLHVHHKDGDIYNNDLDNLQLMSNSEHRKEHTNSEIRNLSFIAVPSKIISIVSEGKADTYDITCEGPYNNYVADGFVVHNSLKTTLALKAIAENQRVRPNERCVFVDVEGSYDSVWAATLGVDNDRLIYVLPDYAEQVVDIVEGLLHATDVGLIVIDSIAAMITANEIKNSAETAVVGGSGLAIGKLYRKSTLALVKARREGRDPTIIAINQVRFKIGTMYGDPETMSGGNAFKFFSSLTVRLYGKDEIDATISKNMPSWKLCSGIVKKWKVPITSRTFEFKMSTTPKTGFPIGEVNDWNTLSSYLKNLNFLHKGEKDKGWVLLGTQYKALKDIKEALLLDPDYNDSVRQVVIDAVLKEDGVSPQTENE